MIWREHFAQPNERDIFFLDDPNLILTSVRARSLLFHFEKRFFMGTGDKSRNSNQIEIKYKDFEVVSQKENELNVKSESSQYGMIFLERKFKNFNPLKRAQFQEDFINKKAQYLFD